MKNAPAEAILAFCKGIFVYALLFQQIIIRKVIDFHGLTHLGEGGGGGLFGHGAAFLQNFHDLGQALLPLLAAVADGLQLGLHDAVQELLHLHVAQTAALIVCLQLVEVLVLGQELGKVLRAAECIQIDEDGVALHLAGVLHAQVVRVGVHGHDLLLDVLRLVGEVDAVAEALAHLGLAVGAGQAQAGAVLGQNDLRLHQSLTVDGVELMNDLAALLDHGALVLACGDGSSLEGGDVRSLADGVSEEAHRNAGLEVLLLDLGLDGGVALQAGDGDEVHIIEAQLGQLRHHGLDEDVCLGGVDAHGQIVQSDLQDVLAHLLRVVGVVGEGLCVSDHDIDLVELARVLQPDTLLQRADIVADMEPARRAVARQNDLFHTFLLFHQAHFSSTSPSQLTLCRLP